MDIGRSSERQVPRHRSIGAGRAWRAAGLVILATALLGLVFAQAALAGGLGFSLTPSKSEPFAVCGRASPGHSECLAILVPAASSLSPSASLQSQAPALASTSFSGSGVGGGYAPADLRSAYDLPSATAGSGQTVAVVDAFDDPSAESDLATYRSHYGISACTTANGCFRKVNQSGGSSYPSPEPGWAVEISLDLDMASAACPKCHILLVEASNNENASLYDAEDEAVALGATEISDSWGGPEEAGETADDVYLHHAGVVITAAAGDEGYAVEYPAASQYVIAVGGTSLTPASNSRGWSETAWNGTGSGCSAYEPKPAWQTDTKCSHRTDNDVAAVASTATPVSVADSYELPSEFSIGEPGWTLVGGTSVSSPLIAGTMALANAYTRSFAGADALYEEAAQNGTGVLDDVTSGNNVKKGQKSCGSYLCEAGPGYDGPTGLGSPYGAPVVLPSPPTVVTTAASSVTQTSATLNATVNPNSGEVSECRFEYGTSTSYGQSASCSSLPGSGSSPVAVSAGLTSLTANTTYHFRISATNAGGEGKGSDETFRTPPASTNPPAVETKAASSVTYASVTLNASVNPNGGNVGKCQFEYGSTSAYGQIASCSSLPGSGTSPVAVSASLAGLAANATYHFRISATNAGGEAKGSDETFKTPLGPQYYKSGSPLKESPRAKTLSWGTLMLTSREGVVQCDTVALGNVWNPAGGGAGRGETLVFASDACVDEDCPGVAFFRPVDLPWPSELLQEADGAIRSESRDVKLRIVCENPKTQAVLSQMEFETTQTNRLTPLTLNGDSGCSKPSELEFGPGSGSLLASGVIEGTMSGALKTCGYEKSELITRTETP